MQKLIQTVVWGIIIPLNQASAQNFLPYKQQLWPQVFVTVRTTNRLALQTDMGMRFDEYHFRNNFQNLFRLSALYKLSNEWTFIAGIAYFETENKYWNTFMPELRAVQRLQWQSKYRSSTFFIRNRWEQRFRKFLDKHRQWSDYTLQHRFALQAQCMVPITATSKWNFVANDELFFQTKADLSQPYMDQNRVFLGVQYVFNQTFSINAGPSYFIVKASKFSAPKEILVYRCNVMLNF